MSFYQVCYTRVGNQEQNAGWHTVAATEGLSAEASESFRAFASNAIRQTSLYPDVPPEIFFVCTDKRFVYMCNLVTECASEDGRRNSFVHGYVMAKNEYYDRCRMPSSLFGWEKSAFIRNISEVPDGESYSLPKQEAMPYKDMNRQELLRKYSLDRSYAKLMYCVISVLERKEASLCICIKSEGIDKLWESSREILFCIMEGLPQMLRVQLTASSFRIGKGKLYFSNQAPKENQEFFDLRSGEYSCRAAEEESIVSLQHFWKEEKNQVNTAWERTERFFDKVFEKNGCALVNSRLIETVYEYNNQAEPHAANEALYDCLNAEPAVCTELYQFLTYLLPWIDSEQSDETTQKKLCYLYELKKDEDYENLYEVVIEAGAKNQPEDADSQKKNSFMNYVRVRLAVLQDKYSVLRKFLKSKR